MGSKFEEKRVITKVTCLPRIFNRVKQDLMPKNKMLMPQKKKRKVTHYRKEPVLLKLTTLRTSKLNDGLINKLTGQSESSHRLQLALLVDRCNFRTYSCLVILNFQLLLVTGTKK